MKTIFSITFGLAMGLASFAQAQPVKVFCVTSQPRGALFFNLDTDDSAAFGRMTHAFTTDINALKEDNPPKGQYSNLFVRYVEKTSEGIQFNASPYVISDNSFPLAKQGNDMSKSFLIIQGQRAILKHFVGFERYMTGECEILK